MIITFNELRRIKDRLPSGSSQRIADELGLDVETVRNYFGLAFRDIFRSAKYISDIQTADLRSLTRIKPKYPQITLTLSWTFNSFKAKSTQAKEDRSEMFEGIKH